MATKVSKIPRECLTCKKSFLPTGNKQRYCGSRSKKIGCAWIHRQKTHKIYFDKYCLTHKEAIKETAKKWRVLNGKQRAIPLPKIIRTKEELLEMSRKRNKTYYKKHRQRLLKKRNELNKTIYSTRNKLYRVKNKEKARGYMKIYKEKNWDKMYARVKYRLKNDIQFKLSILLRGRLYMSIKGNAKSGSAVQDLGCTIEELKTRLESQFQQGMTWDNWGMIGKERKWNIDHIIPLRSFDLTDREQLLKACHYTNLQPLWAEENIRKDARR